MASVPSAGGHGPRSGVRDWPIALLGHVVSMLGWILVGAVLGAALLRAIVYFRDSFRATNYAAPDLIEIIRQIDHRIIEHDLRANAASGVKARTDAHRVTFVHRTQYGRLRLSPMRSERYPTCLPGTLCGRASMQVRWMSIPAEPSHLFRRISATR